VLHGAAGLAGAWAAKASASGVEEPAAGEHLIQYDTPAGPWVEALPVGNGRLGAMVFGRVAQERLQLNEDTLWAGSPYAPANPAARAALPQVRALIAAGRYEEAADLANAKMMAKPLKQMPYGALGDLLLSFQEPETPLTYRRSLDLDQAICVTEFTVSNGAFRREVFASAVDQVIVMRLTAKGGARLNFDIGHRPPGPAHYISWDDQGPATTPSEGQVDWRRTEPPADPSAPPVAITADGDRALLIEGRNIAAQGVAGGLRYAMRLTARGDGDISMIPSGPRVRGARVVTLRLAAATSYVNFRDTSGDPVATVRAVSVAATGKAFAALRSDHIRAHQALYRRVSLDLGGPRASAGTTRDRILAAQALDDPSLSALYFNFGRYLLISSSRPGGQPSNLQGLWNEGTNPPWDSKYTININTEMNYWPAQACGLGACVEPLVRMVEDLAVTGAVTAQVMYGARGWVAHHNTDLWRATAPIDGAFWGLWPTGGAWLCKALWDHYDYSRDEAFLRRIRPLLRGASQFFIDVLVEDPEGRGLITSPSVSPENAHPFGTSVCAGPAMDRQIIRDLFDNTLAVESRLGGDADFTSILKAKRAALAPDRVGAQGQLREWLEDWDAAAPEPHHRHVSHLYAVFPSAQINVRDTPALIEAAKVSLRRRGDEATGWGAAWRANLWARMGDGDHAHAILSDLIGPRHTYPNLFDACPPFQIDGNFGGTSAIVEMLLQSWGGEILILPALPRAWPDGAVRGLRARGGITVDIVWRDGGLSQLTMKGAPGAALAVRYRGRLTDVRLDAEGYFRSAGELL
jgi:alpha-L-fucosidase 2